MRQDDDTAAGGSLAAISKEIGRMYRETRDLLHAVAERKAAERVKAERRHGVRSKVCKACHEGWIVPGEDHCDNCGEKPREGGR